MSGEGGPGRKELALPKEQNFLIYSENPADIERLTYTDQDGHRVLDEEVPEPASRLRITIDGSSEVNGGDFELRADLHFGKARMDVARQVYRQFVTLHARSKQIDEGGYEFLINPSEEFFKKPTYTVWLDKDAKSIFLSTNGNVDVDAPGAALSSLRHGVDDVSSSVHGFLRQTQRLLDVVYMGTDTKPKNLKLRSLGGLETIKTVSDTVAEEEQLVCPALDDLVGLDDEIQQIREFLSAYKYPDLAEQMGLTRMPTGILLYGPAGSGKTTIARAIAGELGAEYREVRVTDFMNKWIGESARELRKIFDVARKANNPTVLAFDEFDSMTQRGTVSHNEVTGLFKKELEEISKENPKVLVIAITNNRDAIDGAVTRSGRFDLKLYIPSIDRPSAHAALIGSKILEYVMNGSEVFDVSNIDYSVIAEQCVGLNGADIDTALRAVVLSRLYARVRQKDEPEAPAPTLATTHDIVRAVMRLRMTKES